MSHTPLSDSELYYSACAAAPDMLEALELVVGHKGFDIEYIHYRCRLDIRKARGELITL